MTLPPSVSGTARNPGPEGARSPDKIVTSWRVPNPRRSWEMYVPMPPHDRPNSGAATMIFVSGSPPSPGDRIAKIDPEVAQHGRDALRLRVFRAVHRT